LYNKDSELKKLYGKMSTSAIAWNVDSSGSPKGVKKFSREQSQETIGRNYVDKIGSSGEKPKVFTDKLTDTLTLDKRGFVKSSRGGTMDEYNEILPFNGDRYTNGDVPKELWLSKDDSVNSKDIIHFYFYDIVNSKYIPFRATIMGLNDQHSADWEEISYLGRADKLYVYKGFTREVNFNFTVYANSLNELVPMWTRINYLVGLSRPSKYTSPDSTKSFMYPPMVTIRIGDMFVDQPCVIKSTGVTIPEDATWETQRGESYTYLQGTGVDLSSYNTRKYQLPTKVDISINMSIMEKKKAKVNDDHYFITPMTSPVSPVSPVEESNRDDFGGGG